MLKIIGIVLLVIVVLVVGAVAFAAYFIKQGIALAAEFRKKVEKIDSHLKDPNLDPEVKADMEQRAELAMDLIVEGIKLRQRKEPEQAVAKHKEGVAMIDGLVKEVDERRGLK